MSSGSNFRHAIVFASALLLMFAGVSSALTEDKSGPANTRKPSSSVPISNTLPAPQPDQHKAPYPYAGQNMLNVKDFGAAGNGFKDDTAAFNMALAAGHSVFVPFTPAGYRTGGSIKMTGQLLMFEPEPPESPYSHGIAGEVRYGEGPSMFICMSSVEGKRWARFSGSFAW